MAEPKAKTLQQKLGFFDEDLKSPTHDEILKWLDKNLLSFIHSIYSLKSWNQKHVKQVKEKAEKLVFVSIAKYKDKVIKTTEQIRKQEDEIKYNEERLLQHKGEDDDFYSELYGKKIDELKTEIKNLGTELSRLEKQLVYLENWAGLGEVPVRREIEITHRPWEFPVVSQSSGGTSGYKSGKNIIGFIDLKISFLYSRITLSGVDFAKEEVSGELLWAQSQSAADTFNDPNVHTFYVEVKTKTPSLGELFRQLRMYQEYLKGDFVIVCPDDSEKELIESQGFLFYKYNSHALKV